MDPRRVNSEPNSEPFSEPPDTPNLSPKNRPPPLGGPFRTNSGPSPSKSKTQKPRPKQPAWLSCDGKTPFSSPQIAAKVAKRRTKSKKLRGKLERVLGSYRCDHCGFHIGGLSR